MKAWWFWNRGDGIALPSDSNHAIYSYKPLGAFGSTTSLSSLTARKRRLVLPAAVFSLVVLLFASLSLHSTAVQIRIPIPLDLGRVRRLRPEDEWERPEEWDPVISIYDNFSE
jgi:hypothetical protein